MLVRQAANALEILEYFARRQRPASAAEIAIDLQWPRSSTFNIVQTLVAKGYLYEPRARGSYYPTPRWGVMAEAVGQAEPLPTPFLALAHALLEATGETTVIAAAAGTEAVHIHVEESRHSVRYFAKAGDRVPIHASSAGRALLAQMTPGERDKLYTRVDFARFSGTTPLSAAAIEAELAAAQGRGWHQSNAEYTPDLAGVALPLPGPRRLSIVVVGPVSRCLDQRAATAAIMQRHIAALPAIDD
ncbi:IclR family transcriptional regulator [Novosphingobium resinovorum]|uniref:IclR family transcriptional regulator n=1 Tax=Novosphingobium resinovorum TaxID=158500 RepID=UPI002ECFEA5E|nr:IclR family transcriptional regulator C-terminal domain-containing protein [Novosphingobium resinovorum]